VGGGRVASRPFTGRKLGALPTILVGLYPDAIEKRRVTTHGRQLCGRLHGSFKT
jgi:hypothetical protein